MQFLVHQKLPHLIAVASSTRGQSKALQRRPAVNEELAKVLNTPPPLLVPG